MMKIVFRVEAPGLSPASPAAQPKTLYRLGSTMGRVEQTADPARPGEDLFIANGHDGWAINMEGKTGKHMIDPTTDQFYFWIVPSDTPGRGTAVEGFELGKEVAFMEAQKVVPKAVAKNGRNLLLYEGAVDTYTLGLYVTADTKTPTEIVIAKDGKWLMRYVYLKYSATLQADPSLFLPGEDVKISEGNILTH